MLRIEAPFHLALPIFVGMRAASSSRAIAAIDFPCWRSAQIVATVCCSAGLGTSVSPSGDKSQPSGRRDDILFPDDLKCAIAVKVRSDSWSFSNSLSVDSSRKTILPSALTVSMRSVIEARLHDARSSCSAMARVSFTLRARRLRE